MDVLHLMPYLIFLVAIAEIVKMTKREMRTTSALLFIQLAVLAFLFLMLASVKVLAVVPVLITAAILVDCFKMGRTAKIVAKSVVTFGLILAGVTFILYRVRV